MWPSSGPKEMDGISGANSYIFNTKEYLSLKAKYEELDNAYQKDKKFYDNALEVRTNQLDEMEEQNEKVK
jgi:hypothetical protein